jgi:hypothetical protein
MSTIECSLSKISYFIVDTCRIHSLACYNTFSFLTLLFFFSFILSFLFLLAADASFFADISLQHFVSLFCFNIMYLLCLANIDCFFLIIFLFSFFYQVAPSSFFVSRMLMFLIVLESPISLYSH